MHRTSSLSPRRRRLFGGAFALLALACLFWFLRPRPSTPDATAESHEDKPFSAPPRRTPWARGSRPPEAPEAAPSPGIRGLVLGANGAALAGATVVARNYQVAGNLPMTVGATQSDAQGHFELPLTDGAYYIHASKEGHGPAYLRAKTGETVSLILYETGVVEGHVRDEQGAAVEHFSIDVISPLTDDKPALAPLWSKVFDTPDGSFRITEMPPFKVRIRASAPGYAPSFSDRIGVGPGEKGSVDLVISPGCTVEGKVADRSGMPLPEVFLDAEARQVAGMGSEGWADAASQAKSDATGHFRLTNVPKGDVIVRAYDGDSAVTTAAIKVSDCTAVAPVEITMSAGGSIAGVVRSADGTPVTGALLTATHRTIGFVQAVADAEGRFRFDQLPATLLKLEVQHEGTRAEVEVRVTDEGVVERDITLPAAGSGVLTGRVSAGGKALAGAQLQVSRYVKQQRTVFGTTTAEDGSYRFDEVPAGLYMLRVSTTGTVGSAQIKGDETATVDLDVSRAIQP